MRFVGIDPGKKGAIAVLEDDGRIAHLLPTPMLAGNRPDYDRPRIAAVFRALCDVSRNDRGLFVTVERLQPMPMKFAKKGGRKDDADANVGGVVANYNRGVAQGWLWLFDAMRIPFEVVLPQAWQREMLKGYPGATTKEQSIEGAKRVWRNVDLRRTLRSRSEDDGFADALWLAERGRRRARGGAVFAGAV